MSDGTRHALRVIHVCYRVADMSRSLRFYGALGFVEQGRLPSTDGKVTLFLAVTGDPIRLQLIEADGACGDPRTAYGHLALEVVDLDQTLAMLAAQNVRPERSPATVNDTPSRTCFVRDPDGYVVELVENAAWLP